MNSKSRDRELAKLKYDSMDNEEQKQLCSSIGRERILIDQRFLGDRDDCIFGDDDYDVNNDPQFGGRLEF